MSRLVELLEDARAPGADPLTVAGLRAFVDALVARLDAPGGRIELAFPYFVRKTAPVSGVASLLDFDVRLTAELAGGRYTSTIAHRRAGDVAVPVLEGNLRLRRAQPALARHDRRAPARAGVRRASSFASPRKRHRASCTGSSKRADEKYVTERAYDNPRFVEDLVRGVAARLRADGRFDGVYASRPRTSSRSTITRRTRASPADFGWRVRRPA